MSVPVRPSGVNIRARRYTAVHKTEEKAAQAPWISLWGLRGQVVLLDERQDVTHAPLAGRASGQEQSHARQEGRRPRVRRLDARQWVREEARQARNDDDQRPQ